MRIMIFAAGSDIGGAKTHIIDLARELSKDHELRLVSFYRGPLSEEARSLGIDTVDIDGGSGIFAAIKLGLNEAKSFSPDIIHCHGGKANLIGLITKRRLHFPVMTTVHSDPRLDYMGRPLRQFFIGGINEYAIKHLDFRVTVADSMRHTLIERGLDPYGIATVCNGLDFSDAKAPSFAGKSVSDTVTVGIAARLTPVKDIPTLLRAFAKASEKNPKLRLSIAGTGEEEEKLRSLARELDIEGLTSFEGWISDIDAYFEHIDINVLCSVSENFPYTLLEGARRGCATVCTKVGGIPALIEHGITGYLFEPGDADSFSEYILRLSENAELRARLSQKLFEKARDEFSLASMVRGQEGLYARVAARKKRPARDGAVLCGAYGRGNSGDDAILHAIVSQLREIDGDMPIWVMSRNPLETKNAENVRSYHIFNIFKYEHSLKKAALFVNGGGSLIQDVTSRRSLMFYLYTLKAARRRGCKVLMFGCGIGPLKEEKDRQLAGRVLNRTADIITLRDSASLKLLREIGVDRPEIILAADPAFSLPVADDERIDAALENEGISPDEKLACFCIREWPGFKASGEVAKAAQYAYEKYGLTPVFFTVEVPKDLEITGSTANMLSCPHHVLSGVYPTDIQIGLLSRMRFVCGMRLHSLIFAAAGAAPVIGISYDVKVDEFINETGSRLCLPCDDLHAEDIERCIDEICTSPRGREAEVRETLTKRETENRKAAARLLGK